MGIWRVSGSTRLQNLAVISMVVFKSTPSGYKLVGIQNRMGTKLASQFNGTFYSMIWKPDSLLAGVGFQAVDKSG
eukprot:902775-Pelagomonas_calceolata.AAC.1